MTHKSIFLKIIFAMQFAAVGFVSLPAAQEEQVDVSFIKANDFYRQGNFNEALKTYELIPVKSAQVYYNMGNCAFKQGKHGYALFYWRRAEKEWGLFGKQELLENIELAKQIVAGNAEAKAEAPSPASLLIRKISMHFLSFVRSAPVGVIQLLFLLFWFFLFIYIKFLYRRRFKIVIGILFTALAFLGIVLVLRYSFDTKKQGVAIKQAAVFSGPNESFPRLSSLPEGQEMTIYKSSEGFYKIRSGMVNGWVSGKDVEKV